MKNSKLVGNLILGTKDCLKGVEDLKFSRKLAHMLVPQLY